MTLVTILRSTSSDTTAPVTAIISGPTLTRISRVSGKDVFEFDWQSNEAFVSYKVKVVPATDSIHSAGTLVEQDVSPASGGLANTTYTANITDDELVAADPSDGAKIVKVFVQDAAGNWST